MIELFLDSNLLRRILSESSVYITDNIVICNPLSIDEKVRLGNWYMTKLAVELGKIEAPMTRKELIEKLQEFDIVDPNGELEVVLDKNMEITDVDLIEVGKDKWLQIK